MFKKLRSRTEIIVVIVGLFLLSFLCTSCGFAYKKHIVGKYYLIGVDTKTDLTMSYELNSGDYVGKAPKQIIAYGYNDTFLVAKSQEYDKPYPTIYIIDMTKDSELAHEETFRIGPILQEGFDSIWQPKLQIQMTIVK